MSGLFISIDGVDGGGKSTQVKLLAEWFRKNGDNVITPRDPGTTALGEALREILLHRHEISLSMTSEMLLYMASRAQLVNEIIVPNLAAGCVIIADRFLLANVVYQGSAGGLEPADIWQIGRVATGSLQPDLTCILDIDPTIATARIERGLDRLESRGLEYMRRVRHGFLEQCQQLSSPCVVIDATQSVEAIHDEIVRNVLKLRTNRVLLP